MNKYDAVERVLDIRDQIQELVHEARVLAAEFVGDAIHSYDAYVFEQINEHCEKRNRYNQDLQDVARAIENSGEDLDLSDAE